MGRLGRPHLQPRHARRPAALTHSPAARSLKRASTRRNGRHRRPFHCSRLRVSPGQIASLAPDKRCWVSGWCRAGHVCACWFRRSARRFRVVGEDRPVRPGCLPWLPFKRLRRRPCFAFETAKTAPVPPQRVRGDDRLGRSFGERAAAEDRGRPQRQRDVSRPARALGARDGGPSRACLPARPGAPRVARARRLALDLHGRDLGEGELPGRSCVRCPMRRDDRRRRQPRRRRNRTLAPPPGTGARAGRPRGGSGRRCTRGRPPRRAG